MERAAGVCSCVPVNDLALIENPASDPRTAQLEILNEVARIATLDLELRPMLQRITDALASKFNWEFVAIATIDGDRGIFVCEAITSSVETAVHVGYSRELGTGVVGEVGATGAPLLINDIRTHANYIETMPGALSELCVPIVHRGRLIAALNLESCSLAAFQDDLPLLTTVADQIAGAVGCAQMYAELEERARLMTTMNEISRGALESPDATALMERVGGGIAAHFGLSRVEFVPPDGDDDITIGSGVLSVPLRAGGEELGTLRLVSRSERAFNAKSVAAFHGIADQLAGAIRMVEATGKLADTGAQLESKTRALEEANAHLSRAIETLSHISKQDGLTGLANRRHFDETISVEWRRAARTQLPISLLLLDLDHFKAFNDEHGHQAGDEMLKKVARCLEACVRRAADLVARYGGEEFVVLLPETQIEHALRIAEETRRAIEAECGMTVSIGVATRIPSRDGLGLEGIVRAADGALYAAKRAGRNRVENATP